MSSLPEPVLDPLRGNTRSWALGSFWTDEISPVGMGSPLRVGPVSAAVPELPDSLLLDFDATGFTGVTAITPSGGHYRFAITKASH